VPIASLGAPNNDFEILFEIPPKDWNAPEGYYPYTMGDLVMRRGWWQPTKEYADGWRERPCMAMDEWGSTWQMDGGRHTTLGGIREPALEQWDNLEKWKPPDPHVESRFEPLRSVRDSSPEKYLLGPIQYFGFTRLTFLRGLVNVLLDFYDHPDRVRLLIDMLSDYSLGMVDEYHKLGADAIFALDDLGSQQAPFFSPALFEEFLAPLYSRVSARVHEHGMDFWLHCCGRINLLIPSLIDAGVDLLEFDSPSHTGIEEVAEEFGGKLAFAACPDIQNTFQNGTPGEMEDFVKRMIRNYGSHNGGFVYYEYPDWRLLDIPEKNVKAAMDAAMKWGEYPLKPGIIDNESNP
jgi:uroporphyrinogen decarboxylase